MTTNITPIEALNEIKNILQECTGYKDTCPQYCSMNIDSEANDCLKEKTILEVITQALAPQECDVTKCEFYYGNADCVCVNLSVEKMGNSPECKCKDNPNCYYKQLHSQQKKEVDNE